jgi:Zn-dependent protease
MFFGDPSFLILRALFLIPAILVGFSLHELAHAWVADLQGDRLPRMEGRLTLDPRRHLDPIGTAAALLLGFGWARPVRVTPARLRGPWGRVAVSAAGPITNLLIAGVFAPIARIIYPFASPLDVPPLGGLHFGMGLMSSAYWAVYLIIWLNLLLAIFNLIPLPPLDGYNVASALLRRRYPRFFYEVDLRGYGILAVVLMLGFALPQLNVIGWFVFTVQQPLLLLLGLPAT